MTVSGCWSLRRHHFAESRGRGPRHSVEDAGEVALVGEAAFGGDHSKRPLRLSQQLAGGSDLQALLIVAGGTILQLAKDAGQMDGMDSGVTGQVAHPQGLAEIFVQSLLHAPEPARASRPSICPW